MKTFIKNNIFTFILILLTFCYVNWYLHYQQVIPDIAISFYHKYANFNYILLNNFSDGMNLLFDSIQSDTRNLIFAALLRPFYVIFGKSFNVYVYAIFFLFFIPAIVVCYRFINKFVLDDCKELGWFKNITKIFLFFSPIFLYTLVLGYPDIFAIGLAILGMGYFFKSDITEKTDYKNLIKSTVFFFLAFMFRRWLFFVWVSFVITSAIFYFFKIITLKNCEIQEKYKKILLFSKNTLICFFVFFALAFVFANNVLHDMFNPQFRQLFKDYAVPISQNWHMTEEWGYSCVYAVWGIYILFFSKTSRNIRKFFSKCIGGSADNPIDSNYEESLSKRNALFAFFFLNSVVYFVIFSNVQIICYDHAMWLVLCGCICFVIALYSILVVAPLKKFIVLLVLLFSFANLYVASSPNMELKSKPFFEGKKICPYSVPNVQILKETENIIRKKYHEDPTYKYRYSLWCFWNDVYNPHLIFQDASDRDLFNAGVFPPLVDTEVIVSNWYSFEVFNVDTIFVLEPIQNYVEDSDKCKILSNTQELLKNKQGFGSAFKLTDKKYFGEYNEQKVYLLQYDRIRPVSKADQDDYYNRMLEWYPWAKDYFPDYFENIWKKKD